MGTCEKGWRLEEWERIENVVNEFKIVEGIDGDLEEEK